MRSGPGQKKSFSEVEKLGRKDAKKKDLQVEGY